MSSMESFQIDVKGGVVRGVLRLPDGIPRDFQAPAVLVFRGLHVEDDDAGGLFDDLTQRLAAEGLTVARFEHRTADLILDDFNSHTVADELDDALAVHRWLSLHPQVDRNHLGVIGYALGAIAASGLLRQVEKIDRLALVSPVSAEHLCTELTRSNGAPAALDPERVPKAYLASLADIDTPREAAFHRRPTLIVHGAADRFVKPEASLEFVQSLELAGCAVERVLVVRADHAYSAAGSRAACVDRLSRFFHAMIQHPVLANQS